MNRDLSDDVLCKTDEVGFRESHVGNDDGGFVRVPLDMFRVIGSGVRGSSGTDHTVDGWVSKEGHFW